MKTISFKINYLVFLMIFGFAVTSCSSDDDSVKSQNPSNFNLIQIPDGSLDVKLKPTFTWSAATSPDASAVSYDVYLGTNNPPTTTIASDLNNTIYALEDNLDFETIYYWKVVAKNSNGNKTESSVSSFKTRAQKNSELLLGKWFLNSMTAPGSSPLDECAKKSSYEFLESGDMNVIVYALNSSDVCELNDEMLGLYEFVSDTKVKMTETSTGDSAPYDIEVTQTLLKLSGQGLIFTFSRAED